MRRAGADLVRDAKRNKDRTSGYAIVTWDEKWNFDVSWQTGKTMPSVCVPEFCKRALTRVMTKEAVEASVFGDPPDEGA